MRSSAPLLEASLSINKKNYDLVFILVENELPSAGKGPSQLVIPCKVYGQIIKCSLAPEETGIQFHFLEKIRWELHIVSHNEGLTDSLWLAFTLPPERFAPEGSFIFREFFPIFALIFAILLLPISFKLSRRASRDVRE